MKKIMAIGGRELRNYETLEIDKRIIELTGKTNPKALFISTASYEIKGYIEAFNKVYGEKLGGITDVLLLMEGKTSSKEAREKILNSNLVYVSGGNTEKMMNVWKEYDVDKNLIEAFNKGIVMLGLNAGSITWVQR